MSFVPIPDSWWCSVHNSVGSHRNPSEACWASPLADASDASECRFHPVGYDDEQDRP